MTNIKIEAVLRVWLHKHTEEEIREHLENKWLSYDIDTDDYETALEILERIVA